MRPQTTTLTQAASGPVEWSGNSNWRGPTGFSHTGPGVVIHRLPIFRVRRCAEPPLSRDEAMTIYRYGRIAWVWRVAGGAALAGGLFLLSLALRFGTRRIPRAALGSPHLRLTAGGTFEQIPSPRIWVPVRRSLPAYFDLLAEIPDLDAFVQVAPLSPAVRRAIRDD